MWLFLVVTKTSKKSHITPILKELHWLPVESRVKYKLSTIVFKSINDPGFPQYLKDIIKHHTPKRNLRSNSRQLLETPRINLINYGQRALSNQAALQWNCLPETLKQSPSLQIFKKKLKTHLFEDSFSWISRPVSIPIEYYMYFSAIFAIFLCTIIKCLIFNAHVNLKCDN